MKNFISIILFTITAVFFTACGSSSDGKVGITVICTTTLPTTPTAVDINTYHELFSGDTIIEDQTGTIVQIHSPAGDNQRVCLESGEAHIKRK